MKAQWRKHYEKLCDAHHIDATLGALEAARSLCEQLVEEARRHQDLISQGVVMGADTCAREISSLMANLSKNYHADHGEACAKRDKCLSTCSSTWWCFEPVKKED